MGWAEGGWGGGGGGGGGGRVNSHKYSSFLDENLNCTQVSEDHVHDYEEESSNSKENKRAVTSDLIEPFSCTGSKKYLFCTPGGFLFSTWKYINPVTLANKIITKI